VKRPYFVTLGDDEERKLTLLVRLPGDPDYFPWGEITPSQRDALLDCGVFELTEEDES